MLSVDPVIAAGLRAESRVAEALGSLLEYTKILERWREEGTMKGARIVKANA